MLGALGDHSYYRIGYDKMLHTDLDKFKALKSAKVG